MPYNISSGGTLGTGTPQQPPGAISLIQPHRAEPSGGGVGPLSKGRTPVTLPKRVKWRKMNYIEWSVCAFAMLSYLNLFRQSQRHVNFPCF